MGSPIGRISGVPQKNALHSRRQLFANAAIAASRVGASPRNGASAAVFVVLAYRRGGSLYDADTAPSASPAAHAATA